MSFRARIALFGSLVVALTILLLSGLVAVLVTFSAPRDRDRLLTRLAREAATQAMQLDPAGLRPGRSPGAVDLGRLEQPFVMVLGPAGEPYSATAEINGVPPALPDQLLGAAQEHGSALGVIEPQAGRRLRLAVVAWNRPDGAASGYAVAGQASETVEGQVRGLRRFLIVAALVSLVTATVAIWLAAGRAVRPLRFLAVEAEAIGASRDLSRRLPPVRSHDEVGTMTDSFNGMLARLEEAQCHLAAALAAQQRFVADASHELRTPLTSMLTNARFLLRHEDAEVEDRRAALRDIVGEGERMSRLARDLLALARADSGQPLTLARMDLADLAGEVVRQAAPVYSTHPISLDAEPAVPVDGDRDRLAQVMWILLDNAARHTPAGTPVRVWVAVRRGLVLLHVSDRGPGIDGADLPRLFDRFYRADRARSGEGAGLGLAIARWIVVAHGGILRAYNNPDGGATFRVEIPQS